ncbi:hypothetical protein A1O1_06666 [Capronia coronata CBS 617.96]|uniref:Acyltransferase 3 domain-containing protein n=1 Tax=Capronia coronata CBS 617.96 TaxID=1182541 RepID=W9YAJ8_9EURO|nr:uncharacterized protein A1O1_06666 [Capronia coronata CBS 617.96]EXJ86296.1 hypothetical protein A1O1_06666 [Capronia coronata CBS 617.96]
MSPSEKYYSQAERAHQQKLSGHGDCANRPWPAQRYQFIINIFNYLDDCLVLSIYCLARLLHCVVPSFLLRHASSSSRAEKRKQTQKIASLDGLRGIACLFVFHAHYAYSFHNWYEGVDIENMKTRFMYQPFVSLLWSGVAMVDIFFFISGYVLVSKSVRLIREQNVSQAFSTISSAVFRRALRLYLPSMAIILISAISAQFGLFNAGNKYFLHVHYDAAGPSEQPPPRLGSLVAQLYDGLKDCYRLTDNTIPWGKFNFAYEEDWNARPSGTVYDKHLWTIPVEFKCSMLIFMILIATARLRATWRLSVHTLFLVNCLFTERFSEFLFIAGMIFSELDAIRQETESIKISDTTMTLLRTNAGTLLKNAINVTLFISGLFLLSMPPLGANEWPQYHAVLEWVPKYIVDKDRFARAIGAIMATWPASTSTLLAPLFTNSVSQYLGQISFALYLVHGPVIKSIWYALQPKFASMITRAQIPDMQTHNFTLLCLLGYMVLLPTVICCADLFWRTIDQRSVTFARWVEDRAKRQR